MKVNMKLDPEKYFEERGKEFYRQLMSELQEGDLVDRILSLLASREFRACDTFEQARRIAMLGKAEKNKPSPMARAAYEDDDPYVRYGEWDKWVYGTIRSA